MVIDSKYVGMLEKYILILERNIELEVLNRKLEETHTQMRADAKGLNKKIHSLSEQISDNKSNVSTLGAMAFWLSDEVDEGRLVKTSNGDEFVYVCGTWRRLIKP